MKICCLCNCSKCTL